MLATHTSAVQVRTSSPRLLIISGVQISDRAAQFDQNRPMPDYTRLIDAFQPDIIDIHNIQARMNPLLALVKHVLAPHWAIALAAMAQRQRYDAIIATGEDVGLPFAFLLKYAGMHIPFILTCHNISTRRPTFFLSKLKVGSVIHKFQCLSRAQARILAERSDLRSDQVQILYWHVDHHFFQPMPHVIEGNQICSAGMACRDYATLVAATCDLDVDVKIAADSPWFRQELNITADTLPAHIEARSYGTYQALRQLYAESRFVVVPLEDVPFSAGYTVILEAMAMGKAVIVSRIAQQDDFIVDGWNGLYVTPGNVAELRERIRFLLDHPHEARRLGANARQTVEERFTLDHYIQRMQAAIADVVPIKQ